VERVEPDVEPVVAAGRREALARPINIINIFLIPKIPFLMKN
jgi:hypothetical protein